MPLTVAQYIYEGDNTNKAAGAALAAVLSGHHHGVHGFVAAFIGRGVGELGIERAAEASCSSLYIHTYI